MLHGFPATRQGVVLDITPGVGLRTVHSRMHGVIAIVLAGFFTTPLQAVAYKFAHPHARL